MFYRYDDMYHLSMTFQDGKTGITRTKEISKCVANYFDENGLLCFDLFEPEITQLQSKISAEGKKDWFVIIYWSHDDIAKVWWLLYWKIFVDHSVFLLCVFVWDRCFMFTCIVVVTPLLGNWGYLFLMFHFFFHVVNDVRWLNNVISLWVLKYFKVD